MNINTTRARLEGKFGLDEVTSKNPRWSAIVFGLALGLTLTTAFNRYHVFRELKVKNNRVYQSLSYRLSNYCMGNLI